MADTELQLAISQLFSSPLCEQLLAACIRETCLTRMDLVGDILLLICLLQHGEVCTVLHSHAVHIYVKGIQIECDLLEWDLNKSSTLSSSVGQDQIHAKERNAMHNNK